MTRGVDTVRTPEPISSPAGTIVPWSDVCEPARVICWYSRSSNSARWRL
jgi:hypothetical protein